MQTRPRDRNGHAELQTEPGPQWVQASSLRSSAPCWAFPGRVPGNAITILEGDAGAGKSTLLTALAAAVTTGRPFLGRPRSTPAAVIWLAGEEDPETDLQPRLLLAEADLTRVHYAPVDDLGVPVPLSFPAEVGLLREQIQRVGAVLVVVDPLVCYMAAGASLTSETEARACLDPLNRLAMGCRVSLVLTRHLKKDRSGPPITHGLGTMGIGATARSVLVLQQPSELSEARVLRVVKKPKGKRLPAVRYRLDLSQGAPLIVGLEDVPADQDDAVGQALEPGDRDVRQRARELLTRLCSTGWSRVKDILQQAEDAHISPRTIDSAKAELGLQHRHVGRPAPGWHEWGPAQVADSGGGEGARAPLLPAPHARRAQPKKAARAPKSKGAKQGRKAPLPPPSGSPEGVQ